MQRMLRIIQLSRYEWLLLFRATLWVIVLRLALWVVPFPVLLRHIDHLVLPATAQDADLPLGRISRTVRRVSRYVPGASCLTQALATQVLLARHSIASTLQIGVAKDEHGKFQAHAWVEHEGRIIIGGTRRSVARYTVLPTLEKIKS